MPDVDFALFPYYPALQRNPGEHLGYRKLSEEDKDSLLPIFEICQHRFDETDFGPALSEIAESVKDRSFLLDLCKDGAPAPFIPKSKPLSADEKKRVQSQVNAQKEYNAALAKLLDPANGFQAWRNLTAGFPNCVPVIQFTDVQSQERNILRQGALLAANGSLAIRITPETDSGIFSIIGQLLAILESADQLLIIVDCGQGRLRVVERAEFARQAMAHILSDVDVLQRANVRAVCVANSFPQVNHDGLKEVENLDWDLWDQAADTFPFFFGDYAATRRLRSATMYVPGDWRATVVYPLDRSWVIYRDPNANDPQGWISGSREIKEFLRRPLADAWGASVIEKAAAEQIDDVRSTRFWYAAKVNLHIHCQIRFAGSEPSTDDYDE